MNLPINQILCGSALEVLKTLPDNSINCCISSPPYWALRDYGVDGQLGLESTFEEYLDKLLAIYDEVKRVLRKDGTCFVNLGDTYNSTNGFCRSTNGWERNGRDGGAGDKSAIKTYPEKCLLMIPERFAIGMIERGWILRNKIIWHKPNPMPSSAGDRFTVDFEPVFFFSKNKQYFFEPQYEECLTESNAERPRMGQGNQTQYNQKRRGLVKGEVQVGSEQRHSDNINGNPLGRNKRCVWTIPTQACKEAHFATYPEKLVQPMIEAGCPMYVCDKCGKPRKKIYEHKLINTEGWGKAIKDHTGNITGSQSTIRDGKGCCGDGQHLFKGYSDCGCNARFSSGIVLDPFGGMCTTAVVAYKLKRDYLMIELNKEYIKMAEKRLHKIKDNYSLIENNPCIVPEPVINLKETNLSLFT